MKVCPKCQASFLEAAEGLVYCPHDYAVLEQYDMRAALRRRRQQAFQSELNFLLPSLSFTQRLQRELTFAVQEFQRHPWLFLKELLRGEGSPRQRTYWLQSGAAVAVIAYTFVITALVLWGVAYGIPTEQVVIADKPHFDEAAPLIMQVIPRVKSKFTQGSNGHLGGSLPQPQRAQGGGSGGRQELLRASAGAVPQAAMLQPVVLPDPHPPKIDNASLVVPMHVFADPKSVRPTLGTIGLPDAPPSPLSSGTGKGGGIGNDQGIGVGDKGKGAGYNSGNNWNTGGKDPRQGGDPTTGYGSHEDIPMAAGSMRPTITYREKARYTEEARHGQVQGSVILLATFTADGRITNIRTLKGLPHGLTEEALKAATRIRFTPAIKNGIPISVQARLEYQFSLY